MADIADLLARLREATGGSYELNWAIAQYLGWTKYWSMMTIYLPPGEIEDDPRHADENWTSGAGTTLPNFTGSLDAAMTLVPVGDPWTLGQNIHHRHWFAAVNEFGPDQNVRSRGMGDHPSSPALALCIAALEARRQQTPEEGEHPDAE